MFNNISTSFTLDYEKQHKPHYINVRMLKNVFDQLHAQRFNFFFVEIEQD